MKPTYNFENENGRGNISQLPGCGRIAVLNSGFVHEEKRGKGHGYKNFEERLKIALDLDYDLAMCTVRADNLHQLKIVKKAGFKRMKVFENNRTKNIIHVYIKDLRA